MRKTTTFALTTLTALIGFSSSLLADGSEYIMTLTGHDDGVQSLEFDITGANLLSVDGKGRMKTWGVWAPEDEPLDEERHKSALSTIRSANGDQYITCNDDGEVQVRNFVDHEIARELVGGNGKPTCMVVSPDGRYIVTGSENNTITVWEEPMETPVAVLSGHTGPVTSLAFSPDSNLLVSGGVDGNVIIWDIASSYMVEALPTGGPVYDVAVNPTGFSLAAAGRDIVTLWDLNEHKIAYTLRGHEGAVNAIAYSPNGRFIISGGNDQTCRIWASTTGRLLATIQADGGVRSVAFSPTGTMIAIGTHEVRDIELDEMVGKSRVTLYDITNEYTDNRITAYVEKQLYHWQKKGEYEKRTDYENRMKGINRTTGELFTKVYSTMSDEISEEVTISKYNAEKETFSIALPTLGAVSIHVPIDRAEAFKRNFHKAVFRNFVVVPAVNRPMESTFKLMSMEVYIPTLQESFYVGSAAIGKSIAPTISLKETSFWTK